MENVNMGNFNKKDNCPPKNENNSSEYWIVATIILSIIIIPILFSWQVAINDLSKAKYKVRTYEFKNDSLNKEIQILKDSLEFKSKVKNINVKKQNSEVKIKSYYDSEAYKNKNIVQSKSVAKKKVKKAKVERKVNTYEETYSSGTCGALTRKRTYCNRQVKGGGRCWQH